MTGTLPDWYAVIVASKWLGVAPWELADAPVAWLEWALAAMGAEGNAHEQRQRKAAP